MMAKKAQIGHFGRLRTAVWFCSILFCFQTTVGQRTAVPESFQLSEAAQKAIDAPWLSDDERRQLRVFHGVWDERDLTTPELRAIVAINAWDLTNSVFEDETIPVELRAQAKLQAGELHEAIELIRNNQSNIAVRIRTEAYERLGDFESAIETSGPLVQRLAREKFESAHELTEGVRALVIRARAQGKPAQDFRTMMELFARAHQVLDRLYWPAKLAEAELLLEKDNPNDAAKALFETLSLNPRCARAWYLLGRLSLGRFDFDSVTVVEEALNRLSSQHPLGSLLYIESRLVQDDPESALDRLKSLQEMLPSNREALAFSAAAYALLYDEKQLQQAFDRFDELSPGSAAAHYIVGRHLAMNRQYEAAAEVLEEAIHRQPAWPAPQIELGLMELQSGRDDRALEVLERVTELDPFNERAAFSLHLLKEITLYEQIESEHFIVRYQPGIDEVLAVMMPERLEQLHGIVSKRFQFEPAQKTIIEVHPNHARFAVRITGMPFVHTVAACTGPVIAMEVPREGPPKTHKGTFDWPRVIQHEYTHTITLAQTQNRIPHWLTEAAAVSMEFAPRDYNKCRLLAKSLHDNELFDLDEIKWAFVRPKRPTDRALAYAQGHWMVEFMNERFGESALVRLIDRYFHGEREQQAIPATLGVSREEFVQEFLVWAGKQVESWGMAPKPTMTELTDEIRLEDETLASAMESSRQTRLEAIVKHLTGQIGRPSNVQEKPLTGERWPEVVRPPVTISDEKLAEWLEKYPDHPDLVELQLRRMLEALDRDPTSEDEEVIALLWKYMHLRSVDPFPHKKLAQIWLASDTPHLAIEHLEELDIREEKTQVYAVELARLYRAQGDTERALTKAIRSLHFNPYIAPNHELAAALAIEAGNLNLAHRHIKALTLIEPGRPQHAKRLQAIERLIAEKNS